MDQGFKKHTKVVRIIDVGGVKSASHDEVESVKKGVVTLADSSLTYSAATGNEIDPALPGCTSYIVRIEGS